MAKVIAIAIVAGLAVGAVGGVVAGAEWLYAGMVIAAIGMGALYALGILKNPIGVAKAEMQVEAEFSGYPPDARAGAEQQQSTRAPHEERPR